MRKIEDIENQISVFEKQVNELSERKNKSEMAVEAARREYAKSIVSAETDERNIEHREAVSRLSIEFDAMATAVDLVKEDLQKAENEKKIVNLYQSEGFRHSSNVDSVKRSVSSLNKDLPRLNNLILSISDSIKNAVSGVEQSCSSLDSVAKELDVNLSLESFLDGHLTAVGDENRETLLNDIGNDLRDSVGALNIVEDLDLAGLQDSITSMVKWRALVTTFDGIGLIKNPKRLYNPVSKRPSTQKIYVPTKIPTETAEATGRPRVPPPKFNRNRPHGEQRILP